MLAKHLAEAVADSVLAVGIREKVDEVGDEVEYLLAGSLGWFLRHPNWPSALAWGGVPFEFSVVVSGYGPPSIRYGVDVTNHRRGMAGNWSRYLEYAKHIIGTTADQATRAWCLLAKHLDGIRATARTRMGHGVGYGPSGFKRASLYFNTYWLSYTDFCHVFPNHATSINRTLSEHGGPTPSCVDWISYDFVDGELSRTKLYWRPSFSHQLKRLSDIGGRHPDLAAAGKVFEHFRASGNSQQISSSLGVQLSFDQEEMPPRQKLMFGCHAWRWDRPQLFLDLLIYLSKTFSLDLGPLYMVLQVFSEHKIRLRPTSVAIGPRGPQPSVSFCFCPVLEETFFTIPAKTTAVPQECASEKRDAVPAIKTGDEVGYRLELVDELVERAMNYVLGARGKDNHWDDFALPQGTSDEWVTAYITAMLSSDPVYRGHLTSSIEWLRERFRPGEGWGYNRNTRTDADSTALSVLALHRMGVFLPGDTDDVLLRYRLVGGGYGAYTDWDLDHEHGTGAAEITAVVLLAQIETGLAEADVMCDAVVSLVSRQRDEGGWNAFWWKDDLFATHRVLQALNAFVRFASSDRGANQIPANIVESAVNAIRRARPSISAQATPDEPFILGLWLTSWLAAQGSVYYPSVDRILCHLRSQQQEDGRWLSVPIRRIARAKLLRPWARSDSGRLYLDSQCLITTSTVIEGLRALRRALTTT